MVFSDITSYIFLSQLLLGWFYFLGDSGKVGQPWKSVGKLIEEKPDVFITHTPVTCYVYSQQTMTGERYYLKVRTITSSRDPCGLFWVWQLKIGQHVIEIYLSLHQYGCNLQQNNNGIVDCIKSVGGLLFQLG